MTRFDFTAALAPPADADRSEDIADILYGGPADDCSVHTTGPTVFVTFHREADSFAAAVASALADLRAEGFEAARIEIDGEDLTPLLEGTAPPAAAVPPAPVAAAA